MFLKSHLTPENRTRLFYGSVGLCLVVLVGIGVFAKNGWFPGVDALSGKRTGWFGSSESTLQRASSGMPPEGGTLTHLCRRARRN